jgi:hypothetical protein
MTMPPECSSRNCARSRTTTSPPSFNKALAAFFSSKQSSLVTRQQIESAVASGIPFTLRMADGREYQVPHPDHISLPPNASYVIVYDDVGHFTVLPLLTMTGLESKLSEADNKQT